MDAGKCCCIHEAAETLPSESKWFSLPDIYRENFKFAARNPTFCPNSTKSRLQAGKEQGRAGNSLEPILSNGLSLIFQPMLDVYQGTEQGRA
jgi:hypothetical protein